MAPTSAPHFDNAVFTRVYYAFDTRADALFLGCLLGLLASDGYLNGWSAVGPELLRWPPWCPRCAFMIWILFDARCSRSAGRLVAAAHHRGVGHHHRLLRDLSHGLGSRFVGLGVFVFIGDLSYTLYLVHFPVYLALHPPTAPTGRTGRPSWSAWPSSSPSPSAAGS